MVLFVSRKILLNKTILIMSENSVSLLEIKTILFMAYSNYLFFFETLFLAIRSLYSSLFLEISHEIQSTNEEKVILLRLFMIIFSTWNLVHWAFGVGRHCCWLPGPNSLLRQGHVKPLLMTMSLRNTQLSAACFFIAYCISWIFWCFCH